MTRREGIEFWNRHLEAWRGSRLTQEASCREGAPCAAGVVAGGWQQAYLRSRLRRQNRLVRPPRTGLGVSKYTVAGEINQWFKKMRAAQMRESVAEREWHNRQQQMRHSQEIEEFWLCRKV